VMVSFKKDWKLHADPVFLPYSEILATIKKAEGPHAVFLHEPFEASSMQNSSDATTTPYTYGIYLTKKGKLKPEPEISFTVMARAETEMEFNFILHNLSKYLQAEADGKTYKDIALYDKEKNFQTLTQKTLLFDREMLDTVKFSREEAQQSYPHKMKFCSVAEIYSAQEKQDPNALFLTYIINQSFNVWTYAIVDAATMDIMAMQTPARVHFGIGRQATTEFTAQQKAKKYGGIPYSYKQPFMIWQTRAKLQLNSKDFKYLGSKATVNSNYSNPLRPAR
jgi:hypothetical protein